MSHQSFIARAVCPLFIVVVCLSGCSTLSDKYKAKDANQSFQAAYQRHVESKYGEGAGNNDRLKFYDDLLYQSDRYIESTRKLDAERIVVLTGQRNELDATYARSRVEAAQFSAVTKVLKKRLIELEAKKLLLAKNLEKNEARIALVERQIDELNVELEPRIIEESNQQARLKSQQEHADQIRGEIAAIAARDYTTLGDQKRRAVRDEIVHEQLLNADSAYLELKNSLLMGRAGADTLLDISELMLSTATTLTGGAMAKANLGAASTLLKGSRTSVDKNFFAQQALAAILNAIEDRRQLDKLTIIKGLGASTMDYPLQQALADVRVYQSRANLMSGVLDLSNQTAANVKKSEQDLVDETKSQADKGKRN